jgi:hypothetical protein
LAIYHQSYSNCDPDSEAVILVKSWLVNEWVRGVLRFSPCEPLLLEAGSWGRGQFGNPEEGQRSPLEATTKQQKWRPGCGH